MKRLLGTGILTAMALALSMPLCLADQTDGDTPPATNNNTPVVNNDVPDAMNSEATTGLTGNSWNNGKTWGGNTPIGNNGYVLPQTYVSRDGKSGTTFYQGGGGMNSGRQDATTTNSGTQRYRSMLGGVPTSTMLLAPNSTTQRHFESTGPTYNSGFPGAKGGIYQGVDWAKSPGFGGILPAVGTGGVQVTIQSYVPGYQ